MAVVVAGTAPYALASNAFQLSASAVSIGRVLVSQPALAAPSGSTESGLEVTLQRLGAARRGQTLMVPPPRPVIEPSRRETGRLDMYL